VIILFLVMPRIKNFFWGLFTLMLCVGLLVHSSLYLFMGYVYDYGDTRYAALVLGMEPDVFMVTGIILTGLFVLAISMAALKFMGRFINLDEDGIRSKTLAMFWFPPLILGGVLSLVFSLTLTGSEMAYPLINSAILLLFLVTAIFLVPMFSEPIMEKEYRLPMKSVISVTLCFILLMAGWAGTFGLSRETAHGILLHEPPVQVENFYSDYSIGNAEITVFTNGSARVDIILRNRMETPSPLDDKIYHTFDERPDWERYIARSRNIIVTMFSLEKGLGQNLTFSTEFGPARVPGMEDDEYGRKCTTYIRLEDAGTRQFFLTPQPGMGLVAPDLVLKFIDPWANQNGYLDEVRITWDTGLEELEILAWNDDISDISYNRGNIQNNTIGWKNINLESSPSEYMMTFRII
ncbi:MAG: hypothetical protein Q7J68_07340, partial [Thermoplasmata archaeon]|nr:hypothetical protein [Thermoplasmata archaeon]